MPMRVLNVWRLGLSLFIFVLSAELIALAWYFAQTGAVFYVHPRTDLEAPFAPDAEGGPNIAMHPYFGYVLKPQRLFHDERVEMLERDGWTPAQAPGSRLATNNFGFLSPYAYPTKKTRGNQFFVGIFGGSVGMWFCQVGVPRLVERLQQSAFFKDREILPLCFSYSGYKQPQLALTLAYFLSIGQVFDLVVNIDGFNDVALSAMNDARGLDISMPSVQHVEGLVNLVNQSTLTPAKLESLTAIYNQRARLAALNETITRNRVAAIDAILYSYYRWLRGRYGRELIQFDTLPSNASENSLVQLTLPVAARERGTLFTNIADQWARSSLLMNELLTAHGATYVHVLQPNQYYTMRRFSDAEAATALTERSPYRRNVEEGYPVLQATARSTLLPHKVFFFDATHVLDREPAPVYLDDCCHYTVIGNRVLADFVAASILDTPGPWRD